jgi:hypothetical protein
MPIWIKIFIIHILSRTFSILIWLPKEVNLFSSHENIAAF